MQWCWKGIYVCLIRLQLGNQLVHPAADSSTSIVEGLPRGLFLPHGIHLTASHDVSVPSCSALTHILGWVAKTWHISRLGTAKHCFDCRWSCLRRHRCSTLSVIVTVLAIKEFPLHIKAPIEKPKEDCVHLVFRSALRSLKRVFSSYLPHRSCHLPCFLSARVRFLWDSFGFAPSTSFSFIHFHRIFEVDVLRELYVSENWPEHGQWRMFFVHASIAAAYIPTGCRLTVFEIIWNLDEGRCISIR